MTTEKVLAPDAGMTLLASFSRNTDEKLTKGVPILGDQGKVGRRLFTKSEVTKASRSLFLLARPVR